MSPRTITSAKNEGYIIDRVIEGRNSVNVIMKPRFFNSNMKAIVNFYITYKGAKRLGINTY